MRPRLGEKKSEWRAGQVLLVAPQDVLTLWPLPAGDSWFFGTPALRSWRSRNRSSCATDAAMMLLLITQLERSGVSRNYMEISSNLDACQKSRVEFTTQLELKGSKEGSVI